MMNKSLSFILSLLTVIALFFIITSGIPLIQAGWLPFLGDSKKAYIKITRNGVIGLTAILGVTYFFAKSIFENLILVKAARWFHQKPLVVSLSIFAAFYTGVMTVVGFMRHQALETRAFDLGIFAQAIWNTLQGDFLYSSIKDGICLLGDHVSPILAAMAPFYALWQDPRVLLIIQAVAAGSCIYLIAWIAREKLQSRGAALVFAFLYVIYFPTRAVLHEDFHPEVVVEPFIFFSFIFLEKKRTISFLMCLLVVITGKENMLGIALILGVYAFAFKGMKTLGIYVVALSLGLFFFETKWLVPHLTNAKYFYGGNYQSMLLGGGSGAFAHFWDGESWEYVLKTFVPFLFISFFHLPTLILTFPILFQNILSSNETMRSFNYHYTTGLTPFLFISAIYGYHTLITKFPVLHTFRIHLLWIIVFASFMKTGASEYYYYWQSFKHETPHVKEVRSKLRAVDPKAIVLTHNNFIPQLANRKKVYQFDYTAVISKSAMAKKYQADYVIMDSLFWEEGTAPLKDSLVELQNAGYKVVDQLDTFYILQKNVTHVI